jgi:hypothetical protein
MMAARANTDAIGVGNDRRPRIARGGILIVGGGIAGGAAAGELGEVTLATPATYDLGGVPLGAACPYAEIVLGSALAADLERRLVEVGCDLGSEAIAYAELVVAPGPPSEQGAGSARTLAERLGLPLDERGELLADETLRVPGVPHVWALGERAIGDSAALGHRLRGVR